jgi:16S rRNA (uracil1498-N3)-methyltransferase
LEEALGFADGYENKLFACEFATQSERALYPLKGSTVIVVGSEGGFAKEEAENAKEKGYQYISLGKRILRAETACVSLTAVVMHALGEWQ